MNRWPPDAMVNNYRGPYPIRELHQARNVLINCLRDQDDMVTQSILPKIGIDLHGGCVIPSPLPPVVRDIMPLLMMNNGHHFPEFTTGPGCRTTPLQHIPPLFSSPFESRKQPFLPQPSDDPHLQRLGHEDDRSGFPSTNDRPFMFGSGDRNFHTRPLLATPLLATPLRYSGGFTGNNKWEELLETDSSYGISSEDIADVPRSWEKEYKNDLLVEQYDQKMTSEFQEDHFNSSVENSAEASMIPNVVDVDISNETLKQILALVGQTPKGCAELPPDSAFQLPVTGPELKPADQDEKSTSESHNDASHTTVKDINLDLCDTAAKIDESYYKLPVEFEKPTKFQSMDCDEKTFSSKVEALDDESLLARHAFKCDYCRYTTKHLNEMSRHLSDTNHLSGSEYLARQSGNGPLELIYTERMLAVRNPLQTRNSRTVFACPQCREIFDDIFMCSQHYKYDHGGSGGYYVICPVIHREFITLSSSPLCSICRKQFSTWMELYEHWMCNTDHSPLSQSSNRQVFDLFVCPFCDRTFRENFVSAAEHLASHSENKPGLRAKSETGVELKQVMLPMRKEKQCDFNPCLNSNGIKEEVEILQRLCSSSLLTTGLKAADARISELQNRLLIS